jgi:hypothetical protein
MDALPPNDPNDPNRRRLSREKEILFSSGQRRSEQRNADGTMDVLGNLQDSPIVVAMFLIGVASWFLRTRCVC